MEPEEERAVVIIFGYFTARRYEPEFHIASYTFGFVVCKLIDHRVVSFVVFALYWTLEEDLENREGLIIARHN